MSSNWSVETYGKWILAGEHAVLRGVPALVFPVRSCYMQFDYLPNKESFHVEFSGPYGPELKLLFWGVLEHALERAERERGDLWGHLTVNNHLPIGAGMGASAALCVGLARMWEKKGWIGTHQIYEFSRSLEDLFHGESSGVDIAAAMSTEGLRFMRGGERQPLTLSWRPQWYLSYSGKRGVTSECVAHVKRLGQKYPEQLEKIDQQMAESVEKAAKALSLSESEGLMMLAHAIDQARDCFEQWGLINDSLEAHSKELLNAGALAVKPTGSGGGGYVLSLWNQVPPHELRPQLLPL